MTLSGAIDALADAIAYAEGFFVSGSRAERNNNPGDLTLDITGKGVGWDGPFVIYATALDGWNALKAQVSLMLTDTSSIYSSNMTIEDISKFYTTTEQSAWAKNVAARLGIPVNVPISSLIAAGVASVGFGVVVLVAIGLLWYSRKGK